MWIKKIFSEKKWPWVLFPAVVAYAAGGSVLRASETPANIAAATAHTTSEAKFTLAKSIDLPADAEEVAFQDGKIVQDPKYYSTPRCYIHLKKSEKKSVLYGGEALKVSKIDNSYKNDAGQAVFFFEGDPNAAYLSCFTNADHSLSAAELKKTVGEYLLIEIPSPVENMGLANLAPVKSKSFLTGLLDDSSEANRTHTVLILDEKDSKAAKSKGLSSLFN